MALRIVPVDDRRSLERFALLPWDIYRGDPFWVPPLLSDFRKLFDPAKHPFHAHSEVAPFLALRGDRPVGRIAAIWNRNHQAFHSEDVGFFGFFESIDDPDVAGALLETAAGWLRTRGLRALRGPANFSSNEEWGCLIDGWNGPPRVMMTYNPRYYPALYEGAGLRKAKDLVAYFTAYEAVPERMIRGADIVLRRNPDARLRPLDMKRFDRDLAIVRELYNRCWEKNWGFVPMTEAEIEHMAKELKPVVDPNLVPLLFKGDEPIGFSLTLPDVYQALRHADGRLFPLGLLKLLWHSRKIRTARVLTLGVVPEHRRSGFDVLLYKAVTDASFARGIQEGEFSWMLEDNLAIRTAMENIGASVYRTYRVYERDIA